MKTRLGNIQKVADALGHYKNQRKRWGDEGRKLSKRDESDSSDSQ